MSYKDTQKLLLRLSGNGRYLTLKSSNIWIYQNVSQHTHLFASVDWQAVNQTDWHSFLGSTKGISIRVYTLKAIRQIQLYWELHIFCPIWSNFYGKGVINRGGWSTSPLKDPKVNTNQFVFSSFGVDPLNWENFMEIGEVAYSSPAWCSHGLTLKYCFWEVIVSSSYGSFIFKSSAESFQYIFHCNFCSLVN